MSHNLFGFNYFRSCHRKSSVSPNIRKICEYLYIYRMREQTKPVSRFMPNK